MNENLRDSFYEAKWHVGTFSCPFAYSHSHSSACYSSEPKTTIFISNIFCSIGMQLGSKCSEFTAEGLKISNLTGRRSQVRAQMSDVCKMSGNMRNNMCIAYYATMLCMCDNNVHFQQLHREQVYV